MQINKPTNNFSTGNFFTGNFRIGYIVVFVFLIGCSLLKASPGQNSGFLPGGKFLKPDPENVPFNGIFYSNKDRFDKIRAGYKDVIVAPVDISYVENKIIQSNFTDEVKLDELESLLETARYFHERLKKDLASYPETSLRVVDTLPTKTPGVIMQIAITELEPTKGAVNFVSTIAGFFIPGTGIIKTLTKGSIAFEAIIRDSQTEEILAEIKDRQTDKLTAFSIKDFEAYAHQQVIVDEWGQQLSQLIASVNDQKIEEAAYFILDPL